MLIEDLLDMTLRDILEEFCFVFSPECGYLYGIARFDDAIAMWDEFDLEEEYCFDTEPIMGWSMEVDFRDEVLEIDKLREILDMLGIKKKA